MKILRINFGRLRNEEHFQFHTEFKSEMERVGAEPLNVVEAFNTYQPLYSKEEEALLLIRKSATTEQLTDADAERDGIFRGIADSVKSWQNHFSPEMRAAAERLKVLLDSYGNVARKPYNEETAAIAKLMLETQNEYASDVNALGLKEWFTELQTKNTAFDTLMKTRYSEEARQTEFRMKSARIELDTVYRTIVERIEALILINGTAGYEEFVRELNVRIEKFNSLLAMRRGRNAKDTDKTETPTSTAS
ncbi:MAG: DUF6261 family protein [Bacteroidales bacterium]